MTNRNLGLIIKHQDLLTLPPTATMQQACKEMCTRKVGAVLVIDQERLVGIFTGRDAANAVGSGKTPDTTLDGVMTRRPETIAPRFTAIDALRRMRDCNFRHLPVADEGGRLIGIVSRTDFLGLELDRLEEEVDLWERIA